MLAKSYACLSQYIITKSTCKIDIYHKILHFYLFGSLFTRKNASYLTNLSLFHRYYSEYINLKKKIYL